MKKKINGVNNKKTKQNIWISVLCDIPYFWFKNDFFVSFNLILILLIDKLFCLQSEHSLFKNDLSQMT